MNRSRVAVKSFADSQQVEMAKEQKGTVYFKATRLDQTDFRTGTVRYEVGKRVRPLPCTRVRKICGHGYLHAADVPAMTLIGGTWPCRLFEVTGKPRVGFDDAQHRHKGGFRQLTVIRELDSHLALGPNGRYVAAIIARTARLTDQEALELDAAWGATWSAAWGAAWGAAWDAAWGAARNAAWDATWHATRDATWHATWHATRDAARGAALATLARDLITPEQFDCLYGPWASVVGAP